MLKGAAASANAAIVNKCNEYKVKSIVKNKVKNKVNHKSKIKTKPKPNTKNTNSFPKAGAKSAAGFVGVCWSLLEFVGVC